MASKPTPEGRSGEPMSSETMTSYRDVWYQSGDGLRLHARDYTRADGAATLLCLHGLTRNAADFEGLCAHLHRQYPMVVAEQRGRGQSAWDPNPGNYNPATYVQDMFLLMAELGLERPVLVGTSMGGLMAMVMNALRPGAFAGVILNDIGPEVNPAGLDRIKGYVGKGAPVATWQEAVAQVRAINQDAFPHYGEDHWQRFARRLYAEDEAGVPRLLYDPAIAQPMAESDASAVPADLWPVFAQLDRVPLLLIRGELSDILSTDTVAEMRRRKPDLRYLEVPGVGHAPMLDEPEAVAAIRAFLATLEPNR